MQLEFIKNKVYYKIFDRTYQASSGIYNKYKNQDAAKLAEVKQNIDHIKYQYNAKELIILKQVHGNNVVFINPDNYAKKLEADASVTTDKQIALSILTADCVPVLLSSDDGNVIGAAHCGWRSAKSNIIKSVNLMMQEKGARNIKAIIGPSIQQKSYEVDSGYYNNFVSDEKSCKDLFIPSHRDDFYMFDLSSYVKRKIEKEKIEILLHINKDTYSNSEKYPSYRRSTHNKEPYIYNILSTIMIK